MPAEEATSIGAFLADDLGAFNHRWVVNQQRAALAAGEIFGLVEALRRQFAKCPQITSFVPREQGMGVILNYSNAMFLGQRHDRVHLAGDAGIMHQDNRPRPFGDQIGQLVFIQVERIWANVSEHRPRPAQREGVDSGDKGKRRDDDLIAGLDVEQQRRHL